MTALQGSIGRLLPDARARTGRRPWWMVPGLPVLLKSSWWLVSLILLGRGLLSVVGCPQAASAAELAVRIQLAPVLPSQHAVDVLGEPCAPRRPGQPGGPARRVPSPGPAGPVPAAGAPPKTIHALEALGQLADITMAQFRTEPAELLLIGPAATPGQGLRFEDWLVVFQAIVLHRAPGVSIEPGPTPETMVVRYFGGIERTAVGAALFEADRLLKTLATGFDPRTCRRLAVWPTPLRSALELLAAEVPQAGVRTGYWRYQVWWELTEDPVEVAPDGRTMRVPTRRLGVRAEVLSGSAVGGSGSLQEFVTLVSTHLPALAAIMPALADMHRQAALVQLAQWMVHKQIPVDQRWLEHVPASVETPNTIPRLTVTKTILTDNTSVQVEISGGVDFQKPTTYGRDDGFIPRLLGAAAPAEPRAASAWRFAFEGRLYQAARLQYAQPVVLRSGGHPGARPVPAASPLAQALAGGPR